MRPAQFLALASAALVCAGAAILVYSTSVEWSRVKQGGRPLAAALRTDKPKVATIEIEQGDKTLTLEQQGETWTIKERDGFPAAAERVDVLIKTLADAELVEPKTRRADRHSLLGLEDPKAKDSKSRLVRLLNDKGDPLVEVVVGNHRRDAFGSATGGTYIRKQEEEQTWLVNTTIDADIDIAAWVKPQLFEAQPSQIKRLTVTMPGDEPLQIERPEDGRHTVVPMPEGMKLKYTNVVDEIVSGASAIAFDDVRKQVASQDDAGKIEVELDNGLKVVFTVKRKDGESWLSLEATGEGDGKKPAETLMARAKGWEFRIPEGKAERMLKRREDILAQSSS